MGPKDFPSFPRKPPASVDRRQQTENASSHLTAANEKKINHSKVYSIIYFTIFNKGRIIKAILDKTVNNFYLFMTLFDVTVAF